MVSRKEKIWQITCRRPEDSKIYKKELSICRYIKDRN